MVDIIISGKISAFHSGEWHNYFCHKIVTLPLILCPIHLIKKVNEDKA